jgi:hypothetical protein
VPLELGGVRLGSPKEEGGLAVGEDGSARVLGVQVLESARREVVAQEPARGAADPERMPAREDVVAEAGLRDLRRLDRAAEPVVPLEDADRPACSCQQGAGGERVDPAPDDDGVEPVQSATP